jgi:hypothetical protein
MAVEKLRALDETSMAEMSCWFLKKRKNILEGNNEA